MPLKTLSRPIIAVIGLIGLSACSVFGSETVEEPDYSVVRQDGDIEIRDYPSLIAVVSAAPGADYDDASSENFGRLFRYIQGANTGGQKIAMTAPVLMQDEPEGEEIAMTAPVLQTSGTEGWEMAFIAPSAYTMDTIPQPADPNVSLREIPPQRFAVIRYSGFLTQSSFEEERADLLAWLAKEGIEAQGPAVSAGYNPPWTIPFLRRNEVLVPIAADAGGA